MSKARLGAMLIVVAVAQVSFTQQMDEQDIDRLFSELKQTLIKRASPDGLLSPSLGAPERQQEAQKAIRPYVGIEFRYNLADLQRDGARARLPLIMEYETARSSGRLTGTARLQKVGDHWYFADFDFMTFPWVLVVGGCAVGIAFSFVILWIYKRSSKRS